MLFAGKKFFLNTLLCTSLIRNGTPGWQSIDFHLYNIEAILPANHRWEVKWERNCKYNRSQNANSNTHTTVSDYKLMFRTDAPIYIFVIQCSSQPSAQQWLVTTFIRRILSKWNNNILYLEYKSQDRRAFLDTSICYRQFQCRRMKQNINHRIDVHSWTHLSATGSFSADEWNRMSMNE